MAYPRPSLNEIQKRVYNDIISKAGIRFPLRKSIVKSFSYAIAAVAHLLYGFIDFVYKEAFPTTCSESVLYIWGYIFNVSRRNSSFARRVLVFKGADGAFVDIGTLLKLGDIEFESTASGFIVSGQVLVEAKALLAGPQANLESGQKLSLHQPIAGVLNQVEVSAEGQINGEDQENLELWRSRIIQRIQNPPHGGAWSDYKRWVEEIPGVTRSWVYPNHTGLGNVGISFVMDSSTDIFPDSSKVNEVFEYIDALRPVTVNVIVFSPNRDEIDFDIQLAPNTPQVREAITESLKDLFKRESSPGGTLYISRIREAISLAVGEEDHVLISPNSNIVSLPGSLPIVGEINFENIS